MGPYGDLHAVGLLGEDVERAGVGVAINENDAPLGLPHERHQQLEGVVDLAVEEHLLPRRLVCLHVVEHALEALVCGLLVLELPELYGADLLEHRGVARDEVAHLDEGIHDAHAHIYGSIAAKHCGEHRNALFGERAGHIAPPRVLFSLFRV